MKSIRTVTTALGTGAGTRWRPGLRTLVVGPTVAVILGMALVVSNSVADQLRHSATDAAIHNIEAIVRGYVDPSLEETSLDLDVPRNPAIDAQLERLTLSGELRRITLWSRDGRVVYSNEEGLRGQRFSIGPLMASAYAGDGVARFVDGAEMTFNGTVPPLSGGHLLLYVPIRGAVDGNPIGIFGVIQDARPIEERIDATRSDVFVVAVVASSALLALLWLAFGGTSRMLAGQNRRLQEQATTERLLLVDLQRSEERFRSLVRNASDGVIVLGSDGLVRYQSPAAQRILGLGPDEGVGRPTLDDVHPDDHPIVQRAFTGVRDAAGSEVAVEFRARHRDGTWRTLEAIVKNLLDDPAVGGLVINFRDITERKALEEQLRHQAFHDVLTGLANRSLFLDRLGHALARAGRGGRPTAVLYLDIDDFKSVNDRLGHGEGDRLLAAIADRLLLATRAGDTVARLGGDEFAIIIEETDPTEAPIAAARIRERLVLPFDIGGREIAARASIGIAIQAADTADAEELLRWADIAMYAAKARGGDGQVIYEPHLYDATVARMELKADVRGALGRGEMHVAYQPIVDIATGAISGTEALMRWTHPTRGQIPPLEFVAIAEEIGLIQDLGRWILETACRQTRAWQVASGRKDLSISVNLSGRQIGDERLAADVAEVLAVTGLAPGHLTLEITESVLVQDVEATVATFRALKGLGVRLAIDDFGTGYSSLSYLRQFPIDTLKIDRSFVGSLDGTDDSTALVRSILSLSSTLRLDTVAEGIETAEQRSALHSLGAHRGQGYLFSRPLEPDAVSDLLAQGLPPAATAAVAANPARPAGSRRRVSRVATEHPVSQP